MYLIDQRNHGKSPHADVFNYQVMADDLLEFYREHKIDKASLIGHSMGAKTAITFSLQHRELVDKLVAVDMGIRKIGIQDEPLQTGLLGLDFEVLTSRAEVDRALEEYIPDWGTRQFIMQNLHWGEDKKLAWRMNVDGIIANIDEIASEVEVGDPYLGPTLYVKGSDSDYITSNDYPALLRAFPNSSIEEIPNAGHWIHVDNPTRFGEVVMKFLKS